MCDVFSSDLDRLGIVVQVKLPAGKRHAALIKLRDYVGSVVVVRLRAKAKQSRVGLGIGWIPGAGNRAMQVGYGFNDLTLAGHGLNPVQLRPQGGEGSRISLFLIGARGPVIADLLLPGC